MAFAFGFEIPIMKGCIAFNAGMSYKNSLASSLAKMGFVGGKYIKMFLNARRVLLLGIERGLTYVADKIALVADQIDWLINKVEWVMNLTSAFEKAGEFADYASKFFNEDLVNMTAFLGDKLEHAHVVGQCHVRIHYPCDKLTTML